MRDDALHVRGCKHPFKIIIHAHVYTVITIFYVFVLISETLVSLYDACDLTYFSTTVPRTLESKCVKDKSKRFRASLVVLRKILCLGHFSIFYRYFFSLPLNIFLLLLLLLLLSLLFISEFILLDWKNGAATNQADNLFVHLDSKQRFE